MPQPCRRFQLADSPLHAATCRRAAGIGAELAIQYGALGAKLVLAARRKTELETVRICVE
jgi:NAD(P)-dependent dehydrogenase (short-subunit alcohol dehydrogenase family)